MHDAEQRGLLQTLRDRFKFEYDAFPRGAAGNPFLPLNNGWFEKVDAEMLYSIVRYVRPARIIEIGSGVTTFLSAAAVAKNHDEDHRYHCSFMAYRSAPLRGSSESLPRALFQQLEAGDILIVDSGDAAGTGFDVNLEIFEILPTLKPGVWIHFHDIFLPWEAPRSWTLDTRRYLNQQYLLQAFLSFHTSFEIQWGSYYMLQTHPRLLEQAFASCGENVAPPDTFLPGSFWIRRLA